ncbi:MAG: family 78 glycoside hydrolase catalytic domain [Actinoplanes sp.]
MSSRVFRTALAAGLALLLGGFSTPAVAAGPTLAVGSLTVQHTDRPLGLDDAHPVLGWKVAAQHNGARQTAYRVVVASSADRARAGRADVWDSGKISDDAVGIPYAGPALASAQRYYWRVEVWGEDGRSWRSQVSWWETGLLTPADWGGAQWIAPDVANQRSWSSFTLDADFTIRSGAAAFLFRAADSATFAMWQINAVSTPGKVLLRPHTSIGGRFANLAEVDLAPIITPATAYDRHHLRIEADGSTFTTWIDGVQADRRVEATVPARGTIGFRSSNTAGVPESTDYDNLLVHDLTGRPLFSDDVSTAPDPFFPQAPVVDGQLRPADGVTLLATEAEAPVLRHTFTLGKTVAQARAYVYGLGLAELHLNGRRVGDRRLTPTASQYADRSLYNTYDVTSELRRGRNAVGMWLGNGYNARYSQYAFRYLGPKKAIMLLRVTFTDGTSQDVTTGPSGWSWGTDAITAGDLYDGESYDARLHQPWDRPAFDDSAWPATTVTTPAPGALVSSPIPPVRVVRTLRPVGVTEPRPGVHIYDFGQNIAGWPRLHVQGARGEQVRMRTAEEVGADGMLDPVTNRAAQSTDTYTLAGGAEETYEPRFTYHGFRYVEVTGFPGTPTPDSLEARVVHADVTSTGTFASSDELLNQIWRMNRWAILNNSMSTPTDTPVRDERTPPAMDVQAYADAATREFDLDTFYAKYLRDLPPGTALPTDDVKAQYPDMAGGQVSLPWTLYEQYGDRATLAEYYPRMKAFVDRNATEKPDHIWPADQGFGDWCPPIHGEAANGGLGSPTAGDCFSEVSLVNTALSYKQAQDVGKAAAALGHPEDATRYAALAEDIKTAFNRHFLNAAGDTYGDGRQTTSVLPLAFGLVPAANVQAVGDRLVHTILVENDGHLDTGIFGTRHLVDALAAAGHIDVAMTVLGKRTYPSFGFQIANGATTPWEQWTYAAAMLTHDHAMFAGVNASLYTQLAGITPQEPGYREILVAPQIPGSLQHAKAAIDTVRGEVASSWTRTAGGLRLEVTIPVTATATVRVPLLGAKRVTATSGARLLASENGYAVYEVGSGHWTFRTHA